MKTYIKSGYGFNVGYNFARAGRCLPIEIDETQGRDVIGLIDAQPDSDLGFLRSGRNGKIRVVTQKDSIVELEDEAPSHDAITDQIVDRQLLLPIRHRQNPN